MLTCNAALDIRPELWLCCTMNANNGNFTTDNPFGPDNLGAMLGDLLNINPEPVFVTDLRRDYRGIVERTIKGDRAVNITSRGTTVLTLVPGERYRGTMLEAALWRAARQLDPTLERRVCEETDQLSEIVGVGQRLMQQPNPYTASQPPVATTMRLLSGGSDADEEFTLRDEANALVAMAFRNGPIEDLHAGRNSKLLEDDGLSRITNAEMKELMVFACEKLAEMLRLKVSDPEQYQQAVETYNRMYCGRWKR